MSKRLRDKIELLTYACVHGYSICQVSIWGFFKMKEKDLRALKGERSNSILAVGSRSNLQYGKSNQDLWTYSLTLLFVELVRSYLVKQRVTCGTKEIRLMSLKSDFSV